MVAHPAAPNKLWLTDIAEHPTVERKADLCAIKDIYSGRIVGYSIGSGMKRAWPWPRCATPAQWVTRKAWSCTRTGAARADSRARRNTALLDRE